MSHIVNKIVLFTVVLLVATSQVSVFAFKLFDSPSDVTKAVVVLDQVGALDSLKSENEDESNSENSESKTNVEVPPPVVKEIVLSEKEKQRCDDMGPISASCYESGYYRDSMGDTVRSLRKQYKFWSDMENTVCSTFYQEGKRDSYSGYSMQPSSLLTTMTRQKCISERWCEEK